jgi:hypothetical protein
MHNSWMLKLVVRKVTVRLLKVIRFHLWWWLYTNPTKFEDGGSQAATGKVLTEMWIIRLLAEGYPHAHTQRVTEGLKSRKTTQAAAGTTEKSMLFCRYRETAMSPAPILRLDCVRYHWPEAIQFRSFVHCQDKCTCKIWKSEKVYSCRGLDSLMRLWRFNPLSSNDVAQWAL